ncbi:MAG: hypothetical protein ACE5KT_10500 [Methanosarcinales archaeon]
MIVSATTKFQVGIAKRRKSTDSNGYAACMLYINELKIIGH